MSDGPTAQIYGPIVGRPVRTGGLRLDTHYDGPGEGEVVLLISGLGRQRIEWPAALIAGLHAAGLATLTVDNRDMGRSTVVGEPAGDEPAYALADVAADHVAVLDDYGFERVHVLGMSMGGMVAQHLAFDHGERLLSLTSVMSTTGHPEVGQPTEEGREVLTTAAPTDREGYIEHRVRRAKAIGTPAHLDEDAMRERAAAVHDRGLNPRGVLRQMRAIAASGDRTDRLAEVRAPTLVLHGSDDPLITSSGGEATARAIPGARFHLVRGMGHDLPLPFLPEILGAVVAHIREAELRA